MFVCLSPNNTHPSPAPPHTHTHSLTHSHTISLHNGRKRAQKESGTDHSSAAGKEAGAGLQRKQPRLTAQRLKQYQERMDQRKSELATSIAQQLQSAEERRQAHLRKKKMQCKQHIDQASAVRKQHQEAEEQWRAHCAHRLLEKSKAARRLTAKFVFCTVWLSV